MFRRLIFLLAIITVLLLVPIVTAQDITKMVVGDPLSYTFPKENDQFFGQFDAKKGDLISLTAKYDGFVIGTLELELRDSVGRSIGLKEDYIFQKFVLAEIPADGTYTVVVNSEKAEKVNMYLRQTTYLGSTPSEVELDTDNGPFFFGVKIDKSGDYQVSFKKEDGELSSKLEIVQLGGFISDTVLDMGGSQVTEWTATLPLDANGNYFAVLDRTLLAKSGSRAKVQITLDLKQ